MSPLKILKAFQRILILKLNATVFLAKKNLKRNANLYDKKTLITILYNERI